MRIQEHMKYIRTRREATGSSGNGTEPKAQGRLPNFEKAYPRVSKPVHWQTLEKQVLRSNFLDSIKDLHEATTYTIKSKEGDSESWPAAAWPL